MAETIGETLRTERMNSLRSDVARKYDAAPEDVYIVRSPYRICPLGAHVDHQLGPVTGLALQHELLFGFVPRETRTIRVSSMNFDGEVYVDLARERLPRQSHWGDYLRGALYAIEKRFGPLRDGLDGIVSGDSRIGGLSSSSSVGCAYLLALQTANEIKVSAADNIELDRVVENEYVGLMNGILDQSMILLSRRGHLTYLECKSAQTELLPLPASAPPVILVVAYSGLSRKLVGTDYNRRVDECRTAAHMLKEMAGLPLPDYPVLGLIPPEVFAAYLDRLPDPFRKRARHFQTESERARKGVELWRSGRLQDFGRLMNESCESSIHDYECGSPHLISLFEIMRASRGVYGARFSGAGFRGCCIAFADPRATDSIGDDVMTSYRRLHPDEAADASIFFCDSADSASVIEPASQG